MVIFFPWIQNHGRKLRLIGRIGKMLGLQCQSLMLMVRHAGFADEGAVKVVAGIKLNTRFGSEDFHSPAADRIVKARRQNQFIISLSIEYKIVIITELQLGNICPQRDRFGQIKRGSFNAF